MLPRGETCVINEDGEYYLSSVEVDDRPDGVPFYEVAPRVLRRVNGLGRVRNPAYEPVSLTGRYTEGSSVHHVVMADGIRIRARVEATAEVRGADGQVLPPAAPDGPDRARVATFSSDVEEALYILGQAEALDWGQLYKVFEIVKDDVSSTSMVDLGWTSAADISAFKASANRPDVSGAAARHSRMGGTPPRHQMSHDVAQAFISRLVSTWIDSKR